jgi:hypothetical protein
VESSRIDGLRTTLFSLSKAPAGATSETAAEGHRQLLDFFRETQRPGSGLQPHELPAAIKLTLDLKREALDEAVVCKSMKKASADARHPKAPADLSATYAAVSATSARRVAFLAACAGYLDNLLDRQWIPPTAVPVRGEKIGEAPYHDPFGPDNTTESTTALNYRGLEDNQYTRSYSTCSARSLSRLAVAFDADKSGDAPGGQAAAEGYFLGINEAIMDARGIISANSFFF